MSLPALLEEGDTYLDDGPSFHLGLAYLAGVLRQRRIEVSILDAYIENRWNQRLNVEDGWIELGLSDDQILDHIAEISPDLIGISVPFSCQHYLAVSIARKIKLLFPHILLIAGGNHISGYTDDPSLWVFDYRILGEGEATLPALIDSINHDQAIELIAGVVQKGEIQGVCSPHIQNLDELPLPALDLLPLEKIWGGGRRWINMIASRGCAYNCVFCSIHTVMGNTIRLRAVENVINEIDHWVSRYGIEEIFFEDDNLTLHRRWAKELFKRIAGLNFGIRLHVRNGVRADSLDKEMLTLMKAAGFEDISISPESGNQTTITKIIHKNLVLEDVIHSTKLALGLNLGVNAFFVMGFPEEKWEDLLHTISFAQKMRELGCSGFWFSLVTPFPGTELYDQYNATGRLSKPLDLRRLRSVDYVIKNPHYSAEELKALRARVMDELAPRATRTAMLLRGLRLVVDDPRFFYQKLRNRLPYRLKQWLWPTLRQDVRGFKGSK